MCFSHCEKHTHTHTTDPSRAVAAQRENTNRSQQPTRASCAMETTKTGCSGDAIKWTVRYNWDISHLHCLTNIHYNGVAPARFHQPGCSMGPMGGRIGTPNVSQKTRVQDAGGIVDEVRVLRHRLAMRVAPKRGQETCQDTPPL